MVITSSLPRRAANCGAANTTSTEKKKTLSLGPFPKIGLAEARAKWFQARKLEDRSAAKRAAKEQKNAESSTEATFFRVANEWYARQSTRVDTQTRLSSLAYPRLRRSANSRFASHRRDPAREIMSIIEAIENRGAGETATSVLQRVRSAFSRAVVLGYREVNPAAELHHLLKPRKKRPQTAISADELPQFLRALETNRENPATRLGPASCHVVTNDDNAAKLSLVENTVRAANSARLVHDQRAHSHRSPLAPRSLLGRSRQTALSASPSKLQTK